MKLSRMAIARLCVAVAAAIAAATFTPAALAGQAAHPLARSNYSSRHACSHPARGHAGCLAQVLIPITPAAQSRDTPIGGARHESSARPGAAAAEGYFGMTPTDFHRAYDLPTEAPSEQTIAIVDAFDDPAIEEDLQVYDEEFGLPECTTANHCFSKLNQQGRTRPLPETEPGWDVEISLDVETAHATCQDCHIMLVESENNSFESLEAAEETAVAHGATEVSNSYGGWGAPPTSAYNHAGVVITASSGDYGWIEPAMFPAAQSSVVAVGGTELFTEEGNWANETAWYGAGSGCSEYEPAPVWQLNLPNWAQAHCGDHRADSDVSADASPWTGAAIYDSIGYEGFGVEWMTVGGTSLSSPMIAATFGLAGGAHGVAYPARTLYEHLGSEGLHDITEGSNGWCEESPICTAGPGWDGPTGVGTPDGLSAFIPSASEPAPAVEALDPAAGLSSGGTQVVIDGSHLGDARSVDFGGSAATILADTEGSLTVATPAHAPGTVQVTVTGSDGQVSAEGAASTYDYVALVPAVTGIDPGEGPAAGGNTVTIEGEGLADATAVQFGGTSAQILSRSAEAITAMAPAHAPGTVDVTVMTAEGTSSPVSAADHYEYLEAAPPVLSLGQLRLTPSVFQHGHRPRLHLWLSEAATVVVAVRRVDAGQTASRPLTLRLSAGAGSQTLALALESLTRGHYVAVVHAVAGPDRTSVTRLAFTVEPQR